MTISRKALHVLMLLYAVSLSANGVGLTQQEAVTARREATNEGYVAASHILECLSMAKQGKDTSGLLLSARDSLRKASAGYSQFIESDRANAAVRAVNDKQLAEEVALVKVRLSDDGIKDLRTEGDVAKANITALSKLEKQVSGWKNCSAVVGKPSELLKLLENKILLERTSQLAESAWNAE